MTHPTPTTPHLTLGVCDYPEQVPQDRWADYARQQHALGLTYVRIAEFAWSRIEPRPGQYDWAWLDHAVQVVADAGLQLVLCTPTAAPPAWLTAQHPDVLPVSRDGRVKTHGSRRQYDFSSPAYREHSRRITRAVAERYGQHPAVIGWQTDNEFGWGDTAQSFSPAALQAFHGWLQARYGTLDALNEAWGNVFWSMDYGEWTQVPLPNHAVAEVNPSHLLDFMRFTSDEVTAFHEEQIALLREHSPGRFVTHNYMGFFGAYDHYRVSAALDFASWDSYPTGTLDAVREWRLADPVFTTTYARTGHPDVTAFNHDLYRGMVPAARRDGRGFWVMEQQCGQVNWAPSNPLPATGAVELWTTQAWAHGADAVVYFRWRAATMAQEVLHSGLLRHDEAPDRGHAEVAALDTGRLPLAPLRPKVAVLHDYESMWLMNAQPHAEGVNYWAQVFLYYRALRALGQDVDIVHPDHDLSGYDVIVAPALTLMTPARAAHLQDAARHARIVFGPRTAFRTVSGRTPEDGQFGPLGTLVGATLRAYDSLPPGLSQEVRTPGAQAFDAVHWAESYELRGAQATHLYQGGPQHGHAAVVRHGHTTVIGAHSEALVTSVLSDLLREAHLDVLPMPEGVRRSQRGGVTVIQNWTDRAVDWQGQRVAPYGSLLLGQAQEPETQTPEQVEAPYEQRR